MRGQLALAFVALSLTLNSADAATVAKKKNKKKAAQVASAIVAPSPTPSPSGTTRAREDSSAVRELEDPVAVAVIDKPRTPEGIPAIAPNSATGPGASVASVAAATPAPTKRKVKGEFYSLSDISHQNLVNHDGAPLSQNYLGIMTSLSTSRSVSIRQPFSYQWPRMGEKGVAKTGDFYLQYMDGQLATIGNSIAVIGQFRIYFPTGERSRFITKTNGALMASVVAVRSFGRLDVSWTGFGTWFNQRQDEFLDATGTRQPNLSHGYIQYVEGFYNISDKLALALDLGTAANFFRGDGPSTNGFNGTAYLFWKLSPELNFSLGLSNDIDIMAPTHSFVLFRPEEVSYFFIVQALL